MLKRFVGAGAVGRLDGEQLANEVLGRFTHRGPDLVGKVIGTGHDALEQFVGGVTVEGRIAREQDVENHTDCPEIDLAVVGKSAQDLGRGVRRRTTAALQEATAAHQFAETEIGDLHNGFLRILGREKEVLWFQITMHNTKLVQVSKTTQNITHGSCSMTLIERLQIDDLFEEFSTFYKVHYQVEVVRCIEDLNHRNTVFVAYFVQNIDLSFQMSNFGSSSTLINHLDCNRVSCLAIDSTLYFGKSTSAKSFLDNIVLGDFVVADETTHTLYDGFESASEFANAGRDLAQVRAQHLAGLATA
mmetsp:Transcript_22832/g.57238  ORF Transcript_22832/g.57238 Transcript_22832/m.57238 type:complete len:302 (-) Transcript_22832:173-1078(-)